jgi:hypothetical protein
VSTLTHGNVLEASFAKSPSLVIDVFHSWMTKPYGPLKPTVLMEHHIDTGNSEPISFPPFHVSPMVIERIREEVAKMKKKNVIKEFLLLFLRMYECTRLPMGLHNGGASFQCLMDLALGDLKCTACLVYLDDLVVMERNFAEHQYRLTAVLTALEKAKLTLNAEKCLFVAGEITCLGHKVSGREAQPNPEKVRAVVDFPSPDIHPVKQRVAAVQSFLGMVSFYRNFI